MKPYKGGGFVVISGKDIEWYLKEHKKKYKCDCETIGEARNHITEMKKYDHS